MSKTSNWQNAEKYYRDVLQKYLIPAYRETRGGNWGKSDYEVKIEGHPEFKGDAKYSQSAPFRHHGKLMEIKEKYCKEKEDVAVLLTKNFKEEGAAISVYAEYFAMLQSYWYGYGTKEELQEIYNKGRANEFRT